MKRTFTILSVATMAVFQFQHHALGETIYSTTDDGTGIATIDSVTGVGTVIGATGYVEDWAAAFDVDGTLYTTINGFGSAQLATVNRTTGVATPVGSPMGIQMICLEVDASGNMYGVGYLDGILYSINKVTGAATPIGGTSIFNMMDLAFNPAGALYGTVGNQLWTINTLTGASTPQSAIIGGPGSSMGITFDASGVLYATDYTVNSGLYTVNLSSGAASFIGATGLNFPHGGDIELGRAVPDAGSTGLLTVLVLSGLALLKKQTA